jgi:hypothetical protein
MPLKLKIQLSHPRFEACVRRRSQDEGLGAVALSPTAFASLSTAVREASALPLPVLYEPWTFNDVAGNQLVSPVLQKIDESPFVVADITDLNLNVIYKIGRRH